MKIIFELKVTKNWGDKFQVSVDEDNSVNFSIANNNFETGVFTESSYNLEKEDLFALKEAIDKFFEDDKNNVVN